MCNQSYKSVKTDVLYEAAYTLNCVRFNRILAMLNRVAGGWRRPFVKLAVRSTPSFHFFSTIALCELIQAKRRITAASVNSSYRSAAEMIHARQPAE